jgi:uncharacterized protein (DUF433 family)
MMGIGVLPALMVFTSPQVRRLTGLSQSTLKRWQDLKVYIPEDPKPPEISGPYRRFYSFRDVVGLRTLSLLRNRHKVPLADLQKAGEYLRRHVDSPWSSMRFWVVNGRVVFRDPGSQQAMAGGDPGQLVIEEIVLDTIAKDIEKESERFKERDPGSIGNVARSRHIMSNQWVVAGTRIPTSVIWEYHRAGYDPDQIMAEYPDLTEPDIKRAIEHEEKLRRHAA